MSGELQKGPTCRVRVPRRSFGPLPRAALAILIVATLAACAGAAGGVPPAGGGAATTGAYTQADVEFIQGMIAHHRQALEMTDLVPTRASSDAIRLLAERIEVSQTDEIAQMSRWLAARGETVPAAGDHMHEPGHEKPVPGMLNQQEMARLAAASGTEFDRLFLQLMIRHHEGALVMVGELLATPGAAQNVDVYRIASEVDSDQRIEIQRMERMLATAG